MTDNAALLAAALARIQTQNARILALEAALSESTGSAFGADADDARTIHRLAAALDLALPYVLKADPFDVQADVDAQAVRDALAIVRGAA